MRSRLDGLTLSSPILRTLRVRVGPRVRWVLSAARGPLRHKRVRRPDLGRRVEFSNADGMRFEGRVFIAARTQPAPGVLLLHGWDPLGQRHGFYLALASDLASQGLNVMTYNLRGYPGSDAPLESAGFNLDALTDDVHVALQAFLRTGHVDRERVFLYGHSYGACLVLPSLKSAGDVISKAVVHGPSIWIEERITGPAASKREFFHERYWRYMQVRKPIPMDLYLELQRGLDMLRQAKTLQDNHPPILLVDGDNDYPGTKEFMQVLESSIGPPIEYYTVPEADHFCNTAAICGLLVEDRKAIGKLVAFLQDWFLAD